MSFPSVFSPDADWRRYQEELREDGIDVLRVHTRTGRSLGSPGFLEGLEGLLNRVLRPQKVGRKPRKEAK